jgi:hypothetical protein
MRRYCKNLLPDFGEKVFVHAWFDQKRVPRLRTSICQGVLCPDIPRIRVAQPYWNFQRLFEIAIVVQV